MKKFWISYNIFLLTVIIILSATDYIVNFNDSLEKTVPLFMGLASWIYVINCIIIMPIWFITLFFKRNTMDKMYFFIGLGLFILFVIIGAFPLANLFGYATF
jgi:hypothetical protein